MSRINCPNFPCNEEGCFCHIFEGPITLNIEGVTALKLESACLKKIVEIGLAEEQLKRVREVLSFLARLKLFQTKAFNIEEQIKTLRDISNSFDVKNE